MFFNIKKIHDHFTELIHRNDIVGHLEDRTIAVRMLFGGPLLKQPVYTNIIYRLIGNLKNTVLLWETCSGLVYIQDLLKRC